MKFSELYCVNIVMTIPLKKRRGMSTVVTSAILVSAVAIMGSFLVSWSSSSFGKQQVDIGELADNRVNAVREEFILEDVWFYNSGGTDHVKMTIRNTGNVAINVTSFYIDSSKFDPKRVIQAGKTDSIDVVYDWTAGLSYTIQVKTERENVLRQAWLP